MEKISFHEDNPEYFWPLYNQPILVECPRCACCGLVECVGLPDQPHLPRLTCTHCGYSKSFPRYGAIGITHYGQSKVTEIKTESALWLQVPCCGNVLWALHKEHLDWLEQYVSASLRTYDGGEQGCANAALQSRLPKWISTKKNRGRVMAGIHKLKERLP